ncbi:helix-turn-helix transcriptional regulator [Dyadobacter sp. CY347]|uniref:helix-turn-helix domain-containing protein n=1 Tax=Dyadobacter sp. CY347 TaxID=2909336 RepID=UPI001F3B03EA|nr:helix-turn-helix transcriptional regulator [Dyadobacter sp. CY347]MCF2487831.1 helix-turn-helix transcriptional regulator [Dyadobacter sp. CY347]
MEKIREKLKNAKQDMTWLPEAQARQENHAWLRISFAIGVSVLSALRERKMTQKDLAAELKCSPQYVNKIVKGSENLTLETICKLEKALSIRLIELPFLPLIS